MQRGLLCTLGTGAGIEAGISWCLQHVRPDFVVFVATDESEGKLDEVAAALPGGELPAHEIIKVKDHEDLEQCRSVCLRGLGLLRHRLGTEAQIYVDFTWGTKAMAAAAAVAGLECRVDELLYVGGRRRDPQGRVVDGAERIMGMRPDRILFDWELRRAQMLFNRRRYAAAAEALLVAAQGLGDPEVQGTTRQFVALARACEAWERFDLAAAAERINELTREDLQALPEGAAQLKGWIIQLAKEVKQGATASVEARFSALILADLLENARRRLEDKDWLAASSRCYRCVEYLAQHILAVNYGVDTRNPDEAKLPQSFRGGYSGGPIGLQQAYALLRELSPEHEGLAKAVLEPGKLMDLLKMRNSSIEAHGLEPVREERARAFFDAVEELVVTAGLDLSRERARCAAPQFADA